MRYETFRDREAALIQTPLCPVVLYAESENKTVALCLDSQCALLVQNRCAGSMRGETIDTDLGKAQSIVIPLPIAQAGAKIEQIPGR
jgi:hypothetical protein